MKKSGYTKLGILIVISVLILLYGLNYLKGIDYFNDNKTYYIEYERVDGLVESSAVMLSGYEVGQVKDIMFSNEEPGKLTVSISVSGDFKIPVGSVARIVSSDLLGTRSIKLQLANASDYYEPNDTITGSIEEALAEQVSMQVLPLKNKAEELLASLDSAITVVTYVFNEESRKNLEESFENINRTINNLEEASAQFNNLLASEEENIHNILSNLDTVTTTLSANADNFASISENLSSLTDSISEVPLKKMLTDMSLSVENVNTILETINSEKGTAGLLINNPNLYNNLTELSASLDYLINDLRNNPKRYVLFSAFDFGKNLYISPINNESTENDSDYTFKVHLLSSPSQINTDNTIFDGIDQVEEMIISGVYNYLTGSSSDFYKILDLHEQVILSFPDASVVAFKNGRKVRLEKALRKNSQ